MVSWWAIPISLVVGIVFGKLHEFMYGYRSRRYGSTENGIFNHTPSWEDPFSGDVVGERGWRRVE